MFWMVSRFRQGELVCGALAIGFLFIMEKGLAFIFAKSRERRYVEMIAILLLAEVGLWVITLKSVCAQAAALVAVGVAHCTLYFVGRHLGKKRVFGAQDYSVIYVSLSVILRAAVFMLFFVFSALVRA